MKFKRDIQRACLEKFKVCSDENVAWLMHSLYMNYNVDGPYTGINDLVYDSKCVCLDHKGRGLYKQLIFGNYGPCGIVYSIEGSPPRGIIIVLDEEVIFSIYGKSKIVPMQLFHSSFRSKFLNCLSDYLVTCYKLEEKKWEESGRQMPDYAYRWEKKDE